MFCMGQDQGKGVELEDKVVESQAYGGTRTMMVPQICIHVILTRIEFETFQHSNFVHNVSKSCQPWEGLQT